MAARNKVDEGFPLRHFTATADAQISALKLNFLVHAAELHSLNQTAEMSVNSGIILSKMGVNY